MPKLDSKTAQAVDDATAMGGGFLIPAGRYAARLRKVTEEPGTEFPQWIWEFEALHDEEGVQQVGRQWNRTSLSPKSRGFLKATFEAFGYSSDSDTDEIVGEWVVLYLTQEKQLQGKGAGQMRNQISRLAPFDADEWPFDPDAVTTGGGAESAAGDEF